MSDEELDLSDTSMSEEEQRILNDLTNHLKSCGSKFSNGFLSGLMSDTYFMLYYRTCFPHDGKVHLEADIGKPEEGDGVFIRMDVEFEATEDFTNQVLEARAQGKQYYRKKPTVH